MSMNTRNQNPNASTTSPEKQVRADVNLKEEMQHVRKSLWSEMNAVSGAILAVIVAIVIGSIALFIYMNQKPAKHIVIQDDADIFTKEDIEDLEDLAKDLKKEHDINIVIATTRDNPYGLSDDDCEKNAAEIYKEKCIFTSMQDNSGVCLYIDLTQDQPGRRFFWLYTYGTAYFAVDDDSCQRLFSSHRKELEAEDYSVAIYNILVDLDQYNYHSTGLVITYSACIIIPLILAGLITLFCTVSRSLDKAPASQEYIDRSSCETLEKSDDFVRKSTRVYHNSSSSGGGFSGGGGGFSGGGGGGGHSGGGGGRF
ncbi:MAG: TPM domain-containing protein [Clostridiales bacterium]|nr:TPM domain-containing protein [Clostridiales bacterium]